MPILDTFADKRQLVRLPYAGALHLLAGQSLQMGQQRLPVFRHDTQRMTVDVVATAGVDLTIDSAQVVGHPIDLTSLPNHCLITFNDGIFCALHALFLLPASHRKLISVIAQFDQALPFSPCPSRMYSPHLPGHVIAALPLLEDWGVFNRVVHANAPGCFDGPAEALRHGFPLADNVIWIN